ncbi:hypothetical protein BKA82DRAFT_17868 [Pisolithus tinctorius]|uniref:Uncharacterized protein n=1 Tax=Pisolithus tinctorius Marx 270 TaxID=870435 RepID=A0A0C3PZ14_PISTI|nr:hypothetical protein BKA82DRAFT_17868 [Pisolithus tinctorius]KIO15011.1 hypothetical protein M404DRAFT_17868 [Pisolithus tinctorius Marx 270]
MSDSRLIVTANNNNEGQAIIDWTQVPDNKIRYNTDDEEEVMKAKSKERKRQKAAEQAWQEEQAWLEANCTHCTQANTICEFLMDGNKKQDAEAGPKAALKADKGKKRKADNKMPKPRPSKKKAKAVEKPLEVLDINEDEASGSRLRGPSATVFSGLEDKLERLINVAGLIANSLVGRFKAHETVAENSGRIANMLEVMLDESYSFSMAVSPSDSGSSELDSNKLCEEAEWLKAHGEDEEEGSEEEDESMAE